MQGLSKPLKRAKTATSNNQEIWLDSFYFMANYFLGISFLDPCFTGNLEAFNGKKVKLKLKD